MKKHTEKLKEDFKKHGYRVQSEKPGLIVFDTDREYYKKHVDKKIHATHPIFTDEHGVQEGDKSTVIVHSMCGHCNEYLEENKCPKCGREYGRFQTAKPHIPYPDELKKGV
jgi:rRNA maturation protein Nop10